MQLQIIPQSSVFIRDENLCPHKFLVLRFPYAQPVDILWIFGTYQEGIEGCKDIPNAMSMM